MGYPYKNLKMKEVVVNYAFSLNTIYNANKLPLYKMIQKSYFSNSTISQVDKGKRKADDMDSSLEEKEAKSKKLTEDFPLDDQVMFDHTEDNDSEEKKAREAYDREYAKWLQQEQYAESNFNYSSFETTNNENYNQEPEYP